MYVKTTSIFLSILVCSSLGAEISCGEDEVEEKCPKSCAVDTCPKDALHDHQPCPKPKECPPPECKCRLNYRRAENGTCIPTQDCPPFSCPGVNEVYEPCPPYCPGDDCREATASGRCLFNSLGIRKCFPTCRCIEGYWRKVGVCVPYKECPPNNNEEILALLDRSKYL